MANWIRRVVVLIGLTLWGGTAFAQNAQITGTLKDQTGGVLPGATVTAKNQETGLLRTAVTEGMAAITCPRCRRARTPLPPNWRASAPRLAPTSSW